MISLVAGGAGFIGSNLCQKLLESGCKVIVVDNFCRGSKLYLKKLECFDNLLAILDFDLSNRDSCVEAFRIASSYGAISEVWHLAANSDIPAGVKNQDIDIKDTFHTTSEIVSCMKDHQIKNILFASSSAIYGDLGTVVLNESTGPLLPISNYGAMKLASEALISASSESFLSRACLFRFPNVVGTPATHGVILDFIKRLSIDPSELEVLGDGSQRKSYLHVEDLVDAMLHVARSNFESKTYPINIGPVDDGVYVRWIAEKVVSRVAPNALIKFGASNKGWVGDVPTFAYSVQKLIELGWSPRMGSEESVLRAIDEIAVQEGF